MKRIIKTLIIVFALWIAIGLVDYFRVSRFERPLFSFLDVENSFCDGGSGTYNGLGYSFDIKGNFMPEDEYPGITSYTYYIFGAPIKTSIRD